MIVTDLRLGNILLGYDKIPFKWDFNHFKLCGDGIDADEIGMPILLTEEWLLKFGFEKGFNTLFKQKNGFGRQTTVSIEFNGMNDIAIWTTENVGTEDETNSTFNIENNLKYVHQMQNLYFSIIGEELQDK